MTLDRQQILDSLPRTVEIEAFGGTVLVQEMPAETVNRWMAENVIDTETGEIVTSRIDEVAIAIAVIVDDKGQRLFSTKDAEALGQKSAGDLMRVMNASLGITNFGNEDPTLPGALASDSSSD